MKNFSWGLFIGAFVSYATIYPILKINRIANPNIAFYIGKILGLFIVAWLFCLIVRMTVRMIFLCMKMLYTKIKKTFSLSSKKCELVQ